MAAHEARVLFGEDHAANLSRGLTSRSYFPQAPPLEPHPGSRRAEGGPRRAASPRSRPAQDARRSGPRLPRRPRDLSPHPHPPPGRRDHTPGGKAQAAEADPHRRPPLSPGAPTSPSSSFSASSPSGSWPLSTTTAAASSPSSGSAGERATRSLSSSPRPSRSMALRSASLPIACPSFARLRSQRSSPRTACATSSRSVPPSSPASAYREHPPGRPVLRLARRARAAAALAVFVVAVGATYALKRFCSTPAAISAPSSGSSSPRRAGSAVSQLRRCARDGR